MSEGSPALPPFPLSPFILLSPHSFSRDSSVSSEVPLPLALGYFPGYSSLGRVSQAHVLLPSTGRWAENGPAGKSQLVFLHLFRIIDS